ncbi:GntR family transcriptional regulator [Sphingopyxis sp. MWB1]|uniref:GntR family transcriptional regulator n=1 Tax=Sphingopyxis sp. MWB1 TaxID=1537715 RepID=UPI000AE7EEDF|nr:GntR family transcriptional regulator [Sphingopyxis sp. MWB1]
MLLHGVEHSLQKKGSTPLYVQLQQLLRDAIAEGRVAAEDAIPTERDLAHKLDVSRITVRKAIDGLVDEGLLTRRRGTGTFVRGARVEKSFSKLSSFSEDMMSRGRHPSTQWVSRAHGAVNPEEALSLGLSPGSPVYRFHRIRYADGAPMALEYSTIASFCLASIDAVEHSLYAALDAAGHRPVRALQRSRAVALDAEQAEALATSVGAPGLYIERRGFLADGRPVEFTRTFYPGDAYDLVAELNMG